MSQLKWINNSVRVMYLHTEGKQTQATIDQSSFTLSFIPTKKNILKEAEEI